MNAFGKAVIVVSSACAVAVCALGVRTALHSPLFTVQAVEVNFTDALSAPVDAQTVTELAAVPVGKANLFSLDLGAIEKRILANPWIRAVRLEMRFPQTLAIGVSFKSPRALIQSPSGLAYVDSDGRPFGRVNLMLASDLPLLSGFESGPDSAARVKEALRWMSAWERSPLVQYTQVASMNWENERGYRALVTYALRSNHERARTMLDLGQEIDADPSTQLGRIHQVLRYLSDNSIASRQIWADTAKKIVVKTAHGS